MVKQAIPYHFVVSDLDGTLLDERHQVTEFTANVLQNLQKSGIPLALATGRHPTDVKRIRAELGISSHLITANGARVLAPDDQVIMARDLQPAIVHALAQPEYAQDTLLNFYTDEAWLLNRPCPALLAFYAGSGMVFTVEDLGAYPWQGVFKVLYMGEYDHLLRVESKLKQATFADQIYITFSAKDCLEVMAQGVSKGQALLSVLAQQGIDPATCLAFGDNQNDAEMLLAVGHPRLMQNADERLKAQLPHALEIGHHATLSVARYLLEAFKMNENAT